MTAAEWRRTLDINTTGGFLCAQAAAKQMSQQGTGGSIIFVASISGHRVNFPQPQVAYVGIRGEILLLFWTVTASETHP
jgi:sorbose reductase